jgi:hypothetical protein
MAVDSGVVILGCLTKNHTTDIRKAQMTTSSRMVRVQCPMVQNGFAMHVGGARGRFRRHRQLNAFTCSCRCLGPERATHFQELSPVAEQLRPAENGLYSVKLTVPGEDLRRLGHPALSVRLEELAHRRDGVNAPHPIRDGSGVEPGRGGLCHARLSAAIGMSDGFVRIKTSGM